MIKTTTLLLALTTTLLFSCNSKDENGESADGDKKESKSVSKRNVYISTSNAYSDFFFDSSLLATYIAENKIPDTIARRMTSFYNTRNYQFAWFSGTGVTEQGRGFWNMYKYYHTYEPEKVLKSETLLKKMDNLVADDDENWKGREKNLTQTEMALTEHFIRFFMSNTEKGYIKRKEMERWVPYVTGNPIKLADSLVTKKHKDDKYYEDINPAYGNLKKFLGQYVAIYKKGGWPLVDGKASAFKPGSTGPQVATLKKRLQIGGDMPGADSSQLWNDTLKAAVENFQYRHGYSASGVLTDAQLKDLNVPVQTRIAQLLVNMGRTQWMIGQAKGKFIMVNIPEFLLHVTEGDKKVFDMAVVVGKEGHNTTLFTGNLNQVVFSPYWNVPESIVRKEILPAMERDPGYLASHNMEVNGDLGNGLPAIRQLPGDQNSLGKVKFLFPNSFDIYFHDTPAKSLFSKDKRAYSHGCIRLSDPKKMATYLLQDDPKWTSDAIDNAMNAGEEKFVRLDKPVPVLITYYTSWVDEAGKLRFAEDIYGHDTIQYAKLFR